MSWLVNGIIPPLPQKYRSKRLRKMVLEVLAAGAVLGKLVAELVDGVKALIEKRSSLKSILKSIKSMLEMITPYLDEITRLDENLNQSGVGISVLIDLVREGKELVDKCSKVHKYLDVLKYQKLLADFETKLLRYFVTVLQLELFKNSRETLFRLKEMQREILGEIKKSVQDLETEDDTSNQALFLLKEMRCELILMKEVQREILGEIKKPVQDLETEDEDTISSNQAFKQIHFEIIKDEAEGSSSRERRDHQANYDKPVMTRQERARGALRTKTAENKKDIVLNYVDSLKKQFGNGVSTKFIIYNATGGSVEHVGDHDWFGNIGPAHYPSQIANGQWGGFLHVKTVGPPSGSVGAVVYRGKNLKDEDCDWMLSWSNPWLRLFQQDNCVYTEIREARHYEQNHWGYINGKLESSGKTHNDNWNGCSSSITSGTGTTVVVEVIMTLKDALIDY